MTEKSRIMVVEDNDFVRMQMVRYLDGDGYDVVEAVNGDDALENFDKDMAIAVVDVRMEPTGGFEFIKAIRARGLETPVVLVTGDNNPDLLNEAGKWSVAAVLIKPVQKERLISTVKRILHHRKSE